VIIHPNFSFGRARLKGECVRVYKPLKSCGFYRGPRARAPEPPSLEAFTARFCLTHVELHATVSVWGSDPTRSEGEHMTDKDADFTVVDSDGDRVVFARPVSPWRVALIEASNTGAFLGVEAATGLRDWLTARLEAMPTPRYVVSRGEMDQKWAYVLDTTSPGSLTVASFFDADDPDRAERLAVERCAELNREVSP